MKTIGFGRQRLFEPSSGIETARHDQSSGFNSQALEPDGLDSMERHVESTTWSGYCPSNPTAVTAMIACCLGTCAGSSAGIAGMIAGAIIGGLAGFLIV